MIFESNSIRWDHLGISFRRARVGHGDPVAQAYYNPRWAAYVNPVGSSLEAVSNSHARVEFSYT